MVVLAHPVRSDSAAGAQRIGIDRDSYDHTQLTLAEFPASDGHEFVAMDYPRLPAAVALGRIDAAVWHRTSFPIPLELIGVAVRLLERPDAIETCETLSRAILLARRDRPEVEAALRELDVEQIRDTQARVLRNEILPVF
jgi:predicted solute-binding protein